MKQTYIKCPRCELNYILKKDKFCNVCKKEMKALGSTGSEEDLDLELCPVCKVNFINLNEDMCAVCAKEKSLSEDTGEHDENWTTYTTPEDDDAGYSDEEGSDMVSITTLDDPLESDDDIPLGISDEDEVEEEFLEEDKDTDKKDKKVSDDDDDFDNVFDDDDDIYDLGDDEDDEDLDE